MNRLHVLGIGVIVAMTIPASAQEPEPPEPPEVNAVFLNMGHDMHGSHLKQMQLQAQARELALKYAKSDKEEEKKDLRRKLADALSQQFDLHMQQQQKELEELEKQIADLRSLIRKRQDAKSSIVERRIDQLAQDAQGMGWTTGTPHWWSAGDFGPQPPPPPPRAKKSTSSESK
jgi:predicted RNase H-like nuclease (RuvC/YqgF family)